MYTNEKFKILELNRIIQFFKVSWTDPDLPLHFYGRLNQP